MKVPWSWLSDYVDLVLPPQELAYRLTMAGAEVEAIERIGGEWDKIVVGRIKEVLPHPNADRLTIAIVEDGGGRTFRVITGASNIRIGDTGLKVALALPGAWLIDGHVPGRKPFMVSAVKIRGEVSEAVICSELELGLSDDHSGVFLLDENAPFGAPLVEHLGETVLEFKLTPNQGHLLSIIGIAREVAALTGQKVRVPQVEPKSSGRPIAELVSITVQDPDLCSRYSAGVILGVKPGPSPAWMQRRLKAAGMRPINNLVDVTNYVMLEYGQPLHAFDYDKLRGKKIIVRRAEKSLRFLTLDGVSREISPDTLVIADGEGPVALGGVMGGLESEVSESTSSILLESANFERGSIRRTSRGLGLRSEASLRFEKGLDPETTLPALMRAMRLLQELAGGEVAQGFGDAYLNPPAKVEIDLAMSEVERLLGMLVSWQDVQRNLESLEFRVQKMGKDLLRVEVPSFRGDIMGAADLIEEVARLIGYDNLPSTLLSGELPQPKRNWSLEWEEKAKEVLAACAFYEAMTYSVVNPKDLMLFPRWDGRDADEPLHLSNPMVPEENTLRPTLLPSLLRNASSNLRNQPEVALFELARVYFGRKGDLPDEGRRLALVIAGLRGEGEWTGEKRPVDLFDLKGAIEWLGQALGIGKLSFAPADYPGFHPRRQAMVLAGNGEAIGVLGEIHPQLREHFALGPRPVFLAELDFETMLRLATDQRQIAPLPSYPAVALDLAFIVDEWITAQKVEEHIREAAGELLERVRLFDVYQGTGLPKGKKSLAYSLSFRSPERTLTDEEAAQALERIVQHLKKAIGVRLRAPGE